MKKDIFTTWIREFCTLVFIQTIQAFIFSIIMILIVSVMTPEGVVGADRSVVVSSTGFIAVLALASISKVEDLVKKIFGIQSSVTDPSMRGGMKSLASTMIAAKLAKGAFDNGKKVVGGVAGTIGANRKMRVAKTRYARDLNRKFGTNSNGTNGGSNQALAGGSGSQAEPQNIAQNTSQAPSARDYMAKAMEAKKAGDMNGYYTNRGIAPGINKVNNNLSSSATSNPATASNRIAAATAGVGDFNLNTSNLSNKDSAELDKLRDAYEDKMSDLKSQRTQSTMKAISGLLETSGAIVGGTGGVLAGAALGDIDDIVSKGLAGMGLGDAIGSIPMKTVNVGKSLVDTYNAEQDSMKAFNSQMESMSQVAKRTINEKRTTLGKYERAKKEFDRMEKQIMDAGNLD